MKSEHLSDDKNLKANSGCSDSAKHKKDCEKRIFCPACGRYIPLDFIVAGLCKDCFMND